MVAKNIANAPQFSTVAIMQDHVQVRTRPLGRIDDAFLLVRFNVQVLLLELCNLQCKTLYRA